MGVVVQIVSGPYTDRRIELEPGRPITVGRTEGADFVIPHDTYLSRHHFALERDSKGCRIRDLESTHGTFVNGKRVGEAVLAGGDVIDAGETIFVVHFDTVLHGMAPPDESATSAATREERLLAMLRDQFQPLYAILDAARDPKVLKLLRAGQEEYQSLYEPGRGAELLKVLQDPEKANSVNTSGTAFRLLKEAARALALEEYAPYLVRVPAESPLLETLVRKAWGKSWGVYLTCYKPLKEVRRHFRRFLNVELPDGERVYFRFYDPRVLRVLLPTCTLSETVAVFGPVSYYLAESELGARLVKFTCGLDGPIRRPTTVAGRTAADGELHLGSLFGALGADDPKVVTSSPDAQAPTVYPAKMLVLRRAQMDVLATSRRLDFEKRMLIYLRQERQVSQTGLSDEGLRQLILRAIEKAATYKIVMEGAVAQFVGLTAMLGENFDLDADRSWIRAILSETNLDSDTRLLWIRTALQREWMDRGRTNVSPMLSV